LVLQNNDEVVDDGHRLKLNVAGFEKFIKLLYVLRATGVFVAKWRGMSDMEKLRTLESLEWRHMMRTMASRYITDLFMFMISKENLVYCGYRVQSRINIWNNADTDNVTIKFRNLGFQVLHGKHVIKEDPTDEDVLALDFGIFDVWATCTRDKDGRPYNASFMELYGVSTGAADIVLKAARERYSRARNIGQTADFSDSSVDCDADVEPDDTNEALQQGLLDGARCIATFDDLVSEIEGCCGDEDVSFILEEASV